MDKYDTFLFDWDGTISNSWSLWLDFILKNAHEYYGLTHVTMQDVIDSMGHWDAPLRFGVPPEKFDIIKYKEICNAYVGVVAEKAELFEGVQDVLKTLKSSNKQIAVVSSGTSKFIQLSIGKHGFSGFFDVVVTGDDVYAHKPDPEPLLNAMTQLSSMPATTLMLGDSVHDLSASNKAGVDALLFFPSEHHYIDREMIVATGTPKYEITSWQKLLK